MHQLDPETKIPVPDDDPLYPYINNDIEYGLFEDIVDSYYLDSQIKDDFQCDQDCYSHQRESTVDDHSISCTHAYDHIGQHIQDLSDSNQQHTIHSMEENTSLFTDDASSIYHHHIEHFFAFFAGNTVFSLVSELPRRL